MPGQRLEIGDYGGSHILERGSSPDTDFWGSITGGINNFMGNILGGDKDTHSKDKDALAKIAAEDNSKSSFGPSMDHCPLIFSSFNCPS